MNSRPFDFDDRSRVYQQLTYAVDPSTGTVGNALTGNNWYDYTGNLIQSIQPGDGQMFTKMIYGASVNWLQYSFRGYNTGGTSFAQASDTPNGAGDTIVEETGNVYDAVGNRVQQILLLLRNTFTGTGALLPGNSRRMRSVTWFDGIDRPIASANYGTNFTSNSTPPASSSTVLVSLTSYDAASGRPTQATDPNGIVTQTTFDAANRTTQTIEDYGTGSNLNRTTNFTYTLDNQIATLTAVNSTTGDQTTTYAYGTTLTASSVARNDLLVSVTYPDSVSGSDVVSYAYNRLGQKRTITDQRGTVRTLFYDKLGRQTNDCVTTNGTGTDVTVKQIATAYEVRGMVSTITSTDSASQGAGTVLNQVQFTYNTFAQLTKEQQSHSGAVGGSTPNVQYAYDTGGSSSNEIRLNQLTYPNGRTIAYYYGTSGGINDYLNRVQTIQDTSSGTTDLATYTYVGFGLVVRIAYPQPAVWLDLWGGTAGTFNGIDLFGRVIDQRWQNSTGSTPVDIDRYQYGYDLNSNRLYKANVVGTAALTPGLDELYAYDNINRLSQMQRGTLNSGKTAITGTVARQMNWTLDPTGNWPAYVTQTSGTTDLSQTRTQNTVNEITAIGGTPGWATPPAYDAAGNMTTMPQVTTPTSSFTATYDAWNRMTSTSAGGSAAGAYQYDGRSRRITKTVSGTTRHFYHRNAWRSIEERVGSSASMDTQSVWGQRYIDELVCRDDATPQRLYACQDVNFNLTSITNTSGAVQQRFVYDPYGIAAVLTAAWASTTDAYGWTCGFMGREYDAETGMYLFRRRYYQPILGRFVTRDPLRHGNRRNLVEFIRSRPTFYVDPLGLEEKIPFDDFWKLWSERAENKDLTPDQLKWAKEKLTRGCIGVSCVFTGNDLGGQPGKTSAVPAGLLTCYSSKPAADKEYDLDKQVKECNCQMISIHLWNDKGRDGTNPDVSEDPATGKANLENWDGSPRPPGDWKPPAPGVLHGVSGIKFDFGYLDADGSVWHADTYHNPEKKNYPDMDPATMTVSKSSLDEWQHQDMFADFNKEVWCVLCKGSYGAK